MLFCFTKNVKAGGLDKGFDALSIHDYFKAKTLFYKALKKDSAAATYGLSVIYSRDNNPFYSLDSALLYIKLSASTFANIVSDKQKEKYGALKVDSISIQKQRINIDEKCFAFEKSKVA